ncbi:hypothetical protein VNO78_27382 [Psophocarpus tetragonolobus]|uniref:Uncharacterized protein n=1 Tax=Psophocarpus tetragonolobus TaxID=3891 RepID=A0AAN9XA15_PSOTE
MKSLLITFLHLESLVEATSGAIGSLLSTTLLYPLDTCTIKFPKVFSLYLGLGTKILHSFVAQFVYFYGYSYFKYLCMDIKVILNPLEPKLTLAIAASAGPALPLMQTSDFGKCKGLLKTLAEGTWSVAFDGLNIFLMLTSNPAIQVSKNFKTREIEKPLPGALTSKT